MSCWAPSGTSPCRRSKRSASPAVPPAGGGGHHGGQFRGDVVHRRFADPGRRLLCGEPTSAARSASRRIRRSIAGQQSRRRLWRASAAADARPVRHGKIATVGAGPNAEQARRPVILERGGVRIGFLATDSIGESPAATSSRPGTNRLDMPPRTGPLDRDDLRRITSDIAALARRADTVVVLTHWGTQYTHRPEPSQRTAARAFARRGQIW